MKVRIKNKRRSMGKKSRWEDRFYVEAYKLAKSGLTDEQIGQALGYSHKWFHIFIKQNPTLRQIICDGRQERQISRESFVDFVIGLLPPDLKSYWQRIRRDKFARRKKTKYKVDRELDNDLRELEDSKRQILFLHSLVNCNFNATEARRLTRVHLPLYYEWLHQEEFSALLHSIQEAKKDLYESALIELVRKGDPSAIIFANRTINRDRGYNDKVEVSVSHDHKHTLSIDDDRIPLELKRQLLQALRQPKQLEDHSVIDAEFEEKK